MELEQFRAPAPVCQNHVGSGETGVDREPGEVLSFSRLIARLPSLDLIPGPREHETAVGGAVRSDSFCCSDKSLGSPLHASLGESSLVRSCSGPGPEDKGPSPPAPKPETLAASTGLAEDREILQTPELSPMLDGRFFRGLGRRV